MRYPKAIPLYSTLLVHLCSLPSIASAGPTYPNPSISLPILSQPSNLTFPNPNPNPSPPVPEVDCFNTTTQLAYPLDPDDCDNAIELLLHDPSGVMTPKTYSWHAREPGSFGIPADWHDGRCQILLTTGLQDAVDAFRLVEVIVAARRVLDDCVPISKTNLGGLALVGNMKGFFVAVNGPAPDGVGSARVRMGQRGIGEGLRLARGGDERG
ncbi:MAG: hypothetical protein Q9161_002912 [Pseudevernia consocians]